MGEEGICEKHEFIYFLEKNTLNWGSKFMFPIIKTECKCSSDRADL
jgi:hypothetical protein